jgi:hypothetical protein
VLTVVVPKPENGNSLPNAITVFAAELAELIVLVDTVGAEVGCACEARICAWAIIVERSGPLETSGDEFFAEGVPAFESSPESDDILPTGLDGGTEVVVCRAFAARALTWANKVARSGAVEAAWDEVVVDEVPLFESLPCVGAPVVVLGAAVSPANLGALEASTDA